nr:DNA-binding protein WhiA [bacterium]
MSFSAEVKREMVRTQPQPCCLAAEWAAMLYALGSLTFSGGQWGLVLRTDNPYVVRRAQQALMGILGIRAEIALQGREGVRKRYWLSLFGPSCAAALEIAGCPAGTLRHAPKAAMLGRTCCKKAFVRGLFLSCGTVSATERGFHMEFVLPTPQLADCLSGVLGKFGITPGHVMRGDHFGVYLKGADAIADVLTMCGAHGGRLQLEDIRVVRDVRNRVNRRINCESSNIDKAAMSSAIRCENIRKLARAGVKLPATLKEAADARLSFPDDTLEELSTRLGISKSALNHRLRRLDALAADVPDLE